MSRSDDGRASGFAFGDQPGLRRRLRLEAKRVASQHEQLVSFLQRLRDAIASGRANEVEDSFRLFREALEAHLTLEDQVLFPAFHGLEAELDAELAGLVLEHRDFRERLETFADALARGVASVLVDGMEAFAESIRDHERREEALTARVFEASRSAPI